MSLWSRFIKLKTAVGGNREAVRYEESFGMTLEEQHRITPTVRHNKRILSEMEFALRLNDAEGGAFAQTVEAALSFLEAAMEADGVLTKAAALKAEGLLMPCAEAAKEYKLILAGHAHIDMDWMWSYHETVALTLSTFRTVLNLMTQYPEFTFSQSQASVYKMVEEYDPEMMEEIKARIREGRWEVTASAWVEADKNMPSTESLLRHIEYTKNYLRDHWDVDPGSLEIDFSPDTFGHSRGIPTIDAFGGVKYMYHCRALDGDDSLYRWRAPSGQELLCYREQYWYNSGIVPKIGLGIFDIARTCGGFKTGLIVYGVGDHGGGPTRRDIEAAIDMQSWPIWPQVKFGTFREFFREAESVREKLPIIDRELNFIFAGCYTTQTRIKAANRRAESMMGAAEGWMAFSGKKLEREKHESAWQNVLYAHFHDIITGSCVQDSREHALGQFQKTFAYAHSNYRRAVEALAAKIDTSSIEMDGDIAASQSEGAGGAYGMGPNVGIGRPSGHEFAVGFQSGVPNPERGRGKTRIFHLFNPNRGGRRVTELTLWDWVGDLRRLRVTDACGNLLHHQLVDGEQQWYWDHRYLRLLVEAETPSMGYTTVIVSEAEAEDYPVYRQPPKRTDDPFDDMVLENEYLRATFHRSTGRLISLVDKETGLEQIGPGGAGLAVVTMERRTNSAWKIGRYLKTEDLNEPLSIVPMTDGPLQKSFTAHYRWGASKLKLTPILRAGERAICFCAEAEWNEVTGEYTAPLLVFRVPLGFAGERFLCDVPGGIQYRAPQNQDIPALRYCAALRGDKALALIPDSKYGYRAEKDALSLSLINTSNNPDPFPDRGLHTVNIALAVTASEPVTLARTAEKYDRPIYAFSAGAHKGVLPMHQSFLELEGKSTVLTAVLPQEDGTLRLRLCELEGKDDSVTLRFAGEITCARSTDLMGNEVPSDIRLSGNEVTLTAKKSSLTELRITL